MRKIDPALEQLLSTEAGTFSKVFGSKHALFVPHKVAVQSASPLPTREPQETPTIIYPLPPEMTPMQVHSDAIWLPSLDRDDLPELQSIGWQWKRDTTGMLNDFLNLADLATSAGKNKQDSIDAKVVEKTRKFVLKWGPLWRCRTPGHSAFCHCSWTLPSSGWQQLVEPGPLCRWAPVEEVHEFVECAEEARAVLGVARLLRESREIPAVLLDRLLIDPKNVTTQQIEKRLELLVNIYLVYLGGPTLSIAWNKNAHAELNLRTGLGFIRVVWLEIAQILCHGKGISQCDGCGDLYIRKGRKPKGGQQNFCSTCGENNRGAKRLSAQKRRAREQSGSDNNPDNNPY